MKLRPILAAATAVAPSATRDLLGIGACSAITYGAALVYVPAGWIVGGVLLLGGVLALSRQPPTPAAEID